jgi:diguanylate cyclase (GGDEF)-like protein
VSLGVAVLPDDGSDAATILRGADRALYAAKDRGRNRVEVSGTGVASPQTAG